MVPPIPGYVGKIAVINLDKRKTWVEETPWNVVNHVIGGKGLGAYYLFKLLPPQIPPLHPQNLFILATGPIRNHRTSTKDRLSRGSRSHSFRRSTESCNGIWLG
ncbi:MAG: hypothetical protein JSU57_01400 [Candidatus Heimdallarchaeota archaeon]|nr:MAG: hypothetical protein JSU57_01400 [Candidatus Heimdallarchaeota archaeon]